MKKLIVLFSTAIGICFGILFAKKSGKELRKELANAKDNKEIASIFGNQVVEAGKDAVKEIERLKNSKEVKDLVKKGKIKAHELSDIIKENSGKWIEEAKKKGSSLMKKSQKKMKNLKKKKTIKKK